MIRLRSRHVAALAAAGALGGLAALPTQAAKPPPFSASLINESRDPEGCFIEVTYEWGR